ncbi:hypothetical protein ACFWN1_31340 [Streptomyces sp. NPDC058459]|uniref:hypothetical protein n=1 Tax=Streptomyces sp. NPDC058459 TaxID=3346508 RepID=UPI003657661C
MSCRPPGLRFCRQEPLRREAEGTTKNAGNQGHDQLRRPSALDNFKPLLIDVALPLGPYYVFREAFGMSTFAALAWSSVGPAARTVWSGDDARGGAWRRLTSGTAAGSAGCRRKERAFSLVWGVALFLECVARAVGAYTIWVDTLVWLGGVLMVVVMVATFVVWGAVAVAPMGRMLGEEAATVPAEPGREKAAA